MAERIPSGVRFLHSMTKEERKRVMITGKLEFHGKTWDDVLEAVELAFEDMKGDAVIGADTFEGGGYTFTTIERPEPEPEPEPEPTTDPEFEGMTTGTFVNMITNGENWNGGPGA